jgi:hypothetical protein
MPSIESTFNAAVAAKGIPGAAIVACSSDGSFLTNFLTFVTFEYNSTTNRCSKTQAHTPMPSHSVSAQ